MKKLMLLSLVVAFTLLGTQAFASPPIQPPVEGFVIEKSLTITLEPFNGKSSFTESEKFDWTYFEGWGKGPFYPNGYTPVGACGLGTIGFCSEDCGATNCNGLVSELGFTEGAQIAYEQTMDVGSGSLEFTKTFVAKSDPDAGDNNLVVTKKIEWEALDATKDLLKHTEKVGLNVISMGAKDQTLSSTARSLLSLCPWQDDGGSNTGGGYPPTNESIAAGSSLSVSRLVGYESSAVVNSSISPALDYSLEAASGDGTISTGFIVDLWEGPKGYVWAPVPLVNEYTVPGSDPAVNYYVQNSCCLGVGCVCDQAAWISQGKSFSDWVNAGMPVAGPKALQVWQLPQQAYGEPPLASRLTYKEDTTATGTWAFSWAVSYATSIPGVAAPASNNAFNNVP